MRRATVRDGAARFAQALLALAISLGSSGHACAQDAQDTSALVPRFAIQRFEVTGNTLLPAAELARAVSPFTGAAREMPDVQRAVEALTEAYRERGYTMVRVTVPEQDITGGVVRLQVQQGRIGKVTVEKIRTLIPPTCAPHCLPSARVKRPTPWKWRATCIC